MGQNLTGKTIASTYEDLVQISGSILTDGLGNEINNLTVTASFATTASYAANAAGVPLALFTASFNNPNLTFTKGDSSTFSLNLSALANGTSGTSGISGTNGSSGTSGINGSNGTSGVVLALAARNYFFTASNWTTGGSPTVTSSLAVTFSSSFASGSDYSIDLQWSSSNAGNAWYDLSYGGAYNYTIINKTNSGFTIVLDQDILVNFPDWKGYVQAIALGEESPAGPAGSNGTSGSSGSSGSSGTSGVSGSSGTSGADGSSGSSGTSGATGPTGAPGTSGTNGSSGTSGAPGTSGTSGGAGAGFPFAGNAVITGSLRVLVSGSADGYTITSGSFTGSLIDNLTTPTASDAIQHVVALSSAQYAAIPTPDNNTLYIIDNSTGPIELGDTNFTGSVNVTGSFKVIGTTTITGSLLQGSTGNSVTDPNSAIIAAGNGNTVSATQAAILGGVGGNSNSAGGGVMIATDRSTMSGGYGLVAGVDSATHSGTGNVTLGGEQHNMAGDDNAIIAGVNNNVNGNNNAVVGGKNNTVSSSYTGSVVLGGTGLSVSKNEEVVVPNLTVNGDLVLNGSSFSSSPANTYSTLQGGATTTYAQKLNITTSATFSMHVSESGVHWVDALGLASPSTSNLNIYVYPDLLNTAGKQAAVLFTYTSGSGNAVQYRTIVTASASTSYYNSGLNLGSSTTNLARQANNSVRNFGNQSTNPTIFTRAEDDTFYLSVSGLPIPVLSYIFSGSQGTPL